MTILIGDNSPRVSYSVAEGVTQTTFTVPFEFFDDEDLNVYVDEVLKTLTTDYTVTGGEGTTGSVSISVTGGTGGSTVVITRSISLERTTDFPPTGPFQVNSLNTELDRIVAISADLQDIANRGLRLSDSDATSSLVLANKDTRKGTVLAFNETTGDVEVGPSIADTQSVAVASADIALLADIQDGTVATNAITTVASISTNVSTVSSNNANVTIVAGETTNMQNITDNLSAVQNAATNATNAATSASNALASEVAAAASEAAAAASETASGISETNAGVSASSASTSATNASNSASAASTSETNAATSASNASTSESNAASSESAAALSASAASTSASAASASASNAATSETNAANSASAASSSQIAAAASAASAANSYDTFDDRYLGSKTADPTVDNDGDALVAGALYFNNAENEMRVYDGGNWIPASSSGGVSITNYNYTATAGQTTFSGTDDNSNTLSYTLANLIVTLNGIVLEDGTDYTANNGTSIVLAVGASADDELNVVVFKSFTTADMVSATNGGTFANDITINADLTVNGAFTSNGIDDNATSTAVTLDSSGNVGIGTSPSYRLDVIGTADGSIVSRVGNLSTGSGSTAVLQLAVGATTERYVNLNTNYTSQYFQTAGVSITTSYQDFDTQIFRNNAGAERMRINSLGNLLVGTTTSTAETSAGQIGFGSNGLALQRSANVAAGGTLDLTINTDTLFGHPGGFVGTLSVSATRFNFPPQSTKTVYAVVARGTTHTFTSLASQSGSGGSSAFTLSMPSNGVVRFTDTSGSGSEIVVQVAFFGTKSSA